VPIDPLECHVTVQGQKEGRLGNELFRYVSGAGAARKLGCRFCAPVPLVARLRDAGFDVVYRPCPKTIDWTDVRESNAWMLPQWSKWAKVVNLRLLGYLQSHHYHHGKAPIGFSAVTQATCDRMVRGACPRGADVSMHARGGDAIAHGIGPNRDHYTGYTGCQVAVSDEPKWIKANLPATVHYLRGTPAVDMCIAGSGKKQVLSGGSYDYFAAYFAKHQDVHMDRRGFRWDISGTSERDLASFAPTGWVQIAPPGFTGKQTKVVVTAASSNHAHVLVGLLEDIRDKNPLRIPITVFDLGMGPLQILYIQEHFPFVTVRTFDYTKYPGWFDVDIARGEYGWKPVIIKEMLDTAASVLWLDAGCGLSDKDTLRDVFRVLDKTGFVTTETSGTISDWVHIKTREFMHANTVMTKSMCNGAIVGFTHATIQSLVLPWVRCALIRECIAPEGSSRANHRQDQAVLSVLAWQEGLGCNIPEGRWADGFHPGPLRILMHQDEFRPTIVWGSGARCGQYVNTDPDSVVPLKDMGKCASGITIGQEPKWLFKELIHHPELNALGRKHPIILLDAQVVPLPPVVLSVIYASYNSGDKLRKTLPYLFANTMGSWELIIVLDGASHDRSFTMTRKVIEDHWSNSTCLRARVVKQPTAVWETSANNIGMRMSSPQKAYALLQPDMLLTQVGWNEALLAPLLQDDRVFAVSGRCGHSFKALYEPDPGSFVGRCTSNVATPIPPYKYDGCTLYVRDTVNRGPLLVHASRVQSMGFMDEVHHLLVNDEHDLILRARMHNFIVGFVPIGFYSPLTWGATRGGSDISRTPEHVLADEATHKAGRAALAKSMGKSALQALLTDHSRLPPPLTLTTIPIDNCTHAITRARMPFA